MGELREARIEGKTNHSLLYIIGWKFIKIAIRQALVCTRGYDGSPDYRGIIKENGDSTFSSLIDTILSAGLDLSKLVCTRNSKFT